MRSKAARSTIVLSDAADKTAHHTHIRSTNEPRKGMGSVAINRPFEWPPHQGMMVRSMSHRLSVLDQSPISQGMTVADALHNSIDLARLLDRCGYTRYWLAEHHGTLMLAGTSPEILIGPIAAATTHLR